MKDALDQVARYESVKLNQTVSDQLIEKSERNMSAALLMFESERIKK